MSSHGVPRILIPNASRIGIALACRLVAAVALFPALLAGQTTTHAQITGIIFDSTGASIPGARRRTRPESTSFRSSWRGPMT